MGYKKVAEGKVEVYKKTNAGWFWLGVVLLVLFALANR